MKHIFQLIRWQNLLFTAVIMLLMEYMVAAPLLRQWVLLPGWLFCLLLFAVVAIAAGGYAINDYFDVRIDAVNRPGRMLVTRTLTKQTAMLCHQVLTGLGAVAGIAAAIVLRSWSLGLIFVFVPGLLWFYSASYKRQFVVGNLIVAFVAALVPLVVAVANAAYLNLRFADLLGYTTVVRDLYLWIGGFALFAFLTTLIREILKDMQDREGDRELECHTLPIRLGDKWTKLVVVSLILLTCGLLCWLVFGVMPFPHTWSSYSVRYLIFGLLIPFACELYLVLTARISSDYRFAQGLMKFIMGVGVLFSVIVFIYL